MGPWDRFVIMLVPIVFILAATGIIILRPLSKRLADVLELLVEERGVSPSVGLEDVVGRLDAIEARIARMEATRSIEDGSGPGGAPRLGGG